MYRRSGGAQAHAVSAALAHYLRLFEAQFIERRHDYSVARRFNFIERALEPIIFAAHGGEFAHAAHQILLTGDIESRLLGEYLIEETAVYLRLYPRRATGQIHFRYLCVRHIFTRADILGEVFYIAEGAEVLRRFAHGAAKS